MNAWYSEMLAASVRGEIDDGELHTRMAAIRQHERMLTDEGVVLLKFWIHLSKAAQKQRLQELDSDRRTRWRVTRDDWNRYRLYARSHDLWEHVLRETSTGEAPWYVVEGTDERYRNLAVGKILLDAMQRMLAAKKPPAPKHALTPTAPAVIDNVKLIRDLDLTQKVSPKAIRARRRALPGQAREADAQQAVRRPFAGPGLRGRRRRRQRRRDSPGHRGAGRAAIRDRADRRAHRRRARASLPVALLAPRSAAGRHRHLRPVVVRPRAGRARRGLLLRSRTGCAPTTRSTSSRNS